MKWMDLFCSASFRSIEKSHIKKEQIGPTNEITKLFKREVHIIIKRQNGTNDELRRLWKMLLGITFITRTITAT